MTTDWNGPDFSGAKIVLLSEGRLIAYQRDMKPDIPFPGMWDLPGGAREGSETPTDCAIRETMEEFGLTVDAGSIVWTRSYPGRTPESSVSYFLVAEMGSEGFNGIEFGNEGQQWAVMTPGEFLDHPEVVGHLKHRLLEYLAWREIRIPA